MFVKVGYIGSKHSVRMAAKVAAKIPSIKLKTYAYEVPADVAKLHKQAVSEIDIICFSGIIPYYFRDRSLSGVKPFVISPFHEYMVAASLLTCILNKNVKVSDISIDLPDRNILNKIEQDIHFEINKDYIRDYRWVYQDEKGTPFRDIADFHEHLYRNNRTKMAVTSVHYVYEMLQQRNVPAIFMVDTDQVVEDVLSEASRRVLFSRLQDGMVTAVFFSLGKYEKISDDAYKIMNNFIQEKFHIQHINIQRLRKNNIIVCYTTRGVVEDFILQTEWLNKLEQLIGEKIYFGIGYGNQIYEAEDNADTALQSAQMSEVSNGYVITDTKKMIGPLIGRRKQDQLRITDEWMHALTKKTNMHMKTIQRFFDFIKLNQYKPFTVSELAAFSRVSARTSERLVKRLYEANVIYIAGQEQSYDKGRPRQVYSLTEKVENKLRGSTVN